MKTIGLLFIVASIAAATIGIRTGFSNTSFTGTGEVDSQIRWYGGIHYIHEFSEIGIEAGVDYAVRAYRWEASSFTITEDFPYLEIPVMVTYRTGAFRMGCGGYVAWLLEGMEDHQDNGVSLMASFAPVERLFIQAEYQHGLTSIRGEALSQIRAVRLGAMVMI